MGPQFAGADADVGRDRGRSVAVVAGGAENLAQQLGGFALDAFGLGAAVTQPGELDAGGAVTPFGQQVKFVQPVGERHRRDVPGSLGRHDLVRGGVPQALRQDAGPRHQEGRREPVGLDLGGGPVQHRVASVQHQVTEFVRRVEAAALTGLARAQEDERLPVPVQRVGVQLVVLGGQRVDPHAVRLEQVHRVRDRPLPQPPAGPDDLRRGFGIVTGQARHVRVRQPEPGLDPVVDQQRDPAGGQRPVALPGGHLAERAEADRLFRDLVDIRRAEECRRDVQRVGQQQQRFLGRRLMPVLVAGNAVRAQAGELGQARQRESAPFPGNRQPRWCQHRFRYRRLISTTTCSSCPSATGPSSATR